MDKRKKLSDADLKKIHRLLKQGVKGEAIMQLMGISSTHFYRIQQAYRNGGNQSKAHVPTWHITNGF